MTQLSRHVERRCNQRGILPRAIELVVENAEREANCGGGCTALEIGRERLLELRVQHGAVADRARSVIVVLNEAGDIVTALRPYNKKSARRYRVGII